MQKASPSFLYPGSHLPSLSLVERSFFSKQDMKELFLQYEELFFEHYPRAKSSSYSQTYSAAHKVWVEKSLLDFLFADNLERFLENPYVCSVVLKKVPKGGGLLAMDIDLLCNIEGKQCFVHLTSSKTFDNHSFMKRRYPEALKILTKEINTLRFFAGNASSFFKPGVSVLEFGPQSTNPEKTPFGVFYRCHPFHRTITERFILQKKLSEQALDKSFAPSRTAKM